MYNDPTLLEQIKQDEGRSAVVYTDSRGLWTIGDGILVDSRVPGAGLKPEEMDFILINRVTQAASDTMAVLGANGWLALDDVRRRALINMCYNLGAAGLAKFVKTLQAIRDSRWTDAVAELKDSQWYKQVPTRAAKICRMIETGEDPSPC